MIRINLLPVRAARKKENIRRQVSVFSLSVFLAFSVLAYGAIQLNRSISELNAKIEGAQGELTQLQAIIKQVNEIKEKLSNLEKKLDIIGMLEGNRSGPVRMMDALTSLVVAEKMWLTSLTETDGKMNLAGVAMDNKTIADFMKRLEKSPCFGEIDLIASKRVQLEDGRKFNGFTMICETLSARPSEGPQT